MSLCADQFASRWADKGNIEMYPVVIGPATVIGDSSCTVLGLGLATRE